MSLAWLRRSSRALAALVLLSSLWQLPHRSQDDEICAPVAEAHDESKHVFTAAAGAAHQDHCAICHWTRWLKPVFAAATAVTANSGSGGELAPFSSQLRRDPASDRRPARAPPSTFL